MFLISLALAHQPWMAEDGQYSSPESAFPVEDIGLSIVVYDHTTCDEPALWLGFDAAEGEELFIQLGMPLLEQQADWRPHIAVIAAGLPTPPDDLPFTVPDGLGMQVYSTEDVTEPTVFSEPFSGTNSWILTSDTLSLPAGPGYVVAWDPSGYAGKLWIATGTREEFTTEDIERVMGLMDEIRAYHELDGATPSTLVDCMGSPAAIEEEKALSTGGCATVGAPLWLGLLAAGLFRRKSASVVQSKA